MSTKVTIASVVIAIGLIGGALVVRSASDKPAEDTPQTKSAQSSEKQVERTFTLGELEEFNGKDGKDCLVAVDKKVYKIEQGRLWKDGEHTTSGGEAHCGKDLTEAMGKSPHGKSKLEAL